MACDAQNNPQWQTMFCKNGSNHNRFVMADTVVSKNVVAFGWWLQMSRSWKCVETATQSIYVFLEYAVALICPLWDPKRLYCTCAISP